VHRWLGHFLATVRRRAPVTAPARPAEPSQRSGVALLPGPNLDIVFRDLQRAGTIRITLDTGPEVAVLSLGDNVKYAVAQSAVVVDNAHAITSYEIMIPKGVARARIRVGDRIVFAKDGATASTRMPSDSADRYIIAFTVLERSAP
jgi:hypothetical protein